MALAIDDALRQARLDPTEVDYISAHGSGTRQNDRHETAAFKRALGAARVPGADQLDQVDGRALARRDRRHRDGRLRPGHRARGGAADGQLDHPRPGVRPGLRARTWPGRCRCDVALSVGSGFGGFQSAMLFRRLAASRDGRSADVGTGSRPGRWSPGSGVVAPSGIGAEAHWRRVPGGHAGGSARSRCSTRPATRPRLGRRGGRLRPAALRRQPAGWCRPTGGPSSASPPPRWRSPTPGCPRRAHDPYAYAVILASSSGGNLFGQRELQRLWGAAGAHGRGVPVDRLVLRGQRRAALHPPPVQGAVRGAGRRGRRRAGQPGARGADRSGGARRW